MTIYTCADFFLARFANLPISLFYEVDSEEKLLEYYQNSLLFQEAIALASAELEKGINSEQKKEKVILSLSKYFSRMCSRCTPFGLFSSVGWGEFNEKTDVNFDNREIKKKARHNIESTASNDQSIQDSKVMVNPKVIVRGNRITLKFMKDKTASKISKSIKNTAASKIILSLAKRPIVFQILADHLATAFPNSSQPIIESYLLQLLENEFLISEFSNQPDKIFSSQTHIDSYTVRSFSLSKNIQKNIEEAATILWHLSSLEEKNRKKISKTLHNYFLEKFGLHRFVPLYELLDDSKIHDILNESEEKEFSDLSIYDLMFSQIENHEIDLSKLVERFPIEKGHHAQPSLELYFELSSHLNKDIDANDFTLVITGATGQASSTFARFMYLWDQTKIDAMRDLLKKEESLYPHIIFVESSFVPEHASAASLGFYTPLRTTHFKMHYHEPTQADIGINDILIGANKDHLYAFSKKLNKELSFVTTSALNLEIAPIALQLLLIISKSRFVNINSFFWKKLNNCYHYPRIKFKNIVFSPARWRLTQGMVEIDSFENTKKNLQKALKEYRVDQIVYLSHNENKILIDCNKSMYIDMLTSEFIRNKEIVLFENITNHLDNEHVAEFVVPLVRKSPSAVDKFRYPTTEQFSLQKRILSPDSDWLYAKLFLSQESADDFLKECIIPYLELMTHNLEIYKWFYVRYKEDQFQIRLRIHSKLDILSSFNQWVYSLLLENRIENFCLCPYEREIERYECIESAEKVFFEDSLACAHLLINMEELNKSFPIHIIAAFGIIHFLSFCNESFSSFFDSIKNQKHHLEGFRPYSKAALEMTNHLFISPAPIKSNVYETLATAYAKISSSLKDYKPSLITFESLIHMHCNRLGLNPDLELKAKVIAHYLLEKKLFALHRRLPQVMLNNRS